MDPDHRPLVVIIAGTAWHGHRLGAQHIAERLTRYARVLYVDPPRSFVGLRRIRQRHGIAATVGLEALGSSGLHRLGPAVLPGKSRPGGRALARALLVVQVRRAIAALGGPLHAVVQIPVHHPVVDAFGATRRVHFASDDFVAAARLNDVDIEWVRRAERRVARSVDTVIAVSPALQQRWRAHGFEPLLIPNGCDVELYGDLDAVAPAADVELEPPVAGFIGTLSERTDVSLLEAVADRGRSLLLVGPRSFTAPGGRLDALLARPNVQWVGPRPHTDLPAYMRHIRVGLVPYGLDDFSTASFPLKTLDYLAAGRAVVSTDLPASRVVGTDVVAVVGTARAFADAVDDLLDAPDDEPAMARRRARAADYSWDSQVAQIAHVLGLEPLPTPP